MREVATLLGIVSFPWTRLNDLNEWLHYVALQPWWNCEDVGCYGTFLPFSGELHLETNGPISWSISTGWMGADIGWPMLRWSDSSQPGSQDMFGENMWRPNSKSNWAEFNHAARRILVINWRGWSESRKHSYCQLLETTKTRSFGVVSVV